MGWRGDLLLPESRRTRWLGLLAPACNSDGLAARCGEEPEGKCSGEEGLYSRGNAALNRGFNREELGAESTGVSKLGKNTMTSAVMSPFLFNFIISARCKYE